MIRIVHRRSGSFVCLNCGGVEDVYMPDRQSVWKHIDDFHWVYGREEPELLSIQEP